MQPVPKKAAPGHLGGLGQGFVDITPNPDPHAVPGPNEGGNYKVPSLSAVLMTDFDADGRDEVIYSPAGWEGSTVAPLAYAYQDGVLRRLPLVFPPHTSVRAGADMDGDGISDLVLDGPGILWGNGKGGFSAPDWLTGTQSSSWAAIALADMDGDGWLDVIQVRNPMITGGRDLAVYAHVSGRKFKYLPEVIAQPSGGWVSSVGVVSVDKMPTLVVGVERQQPDDPPPMRFYRPDKQGVWRGFDPLPQTNPALMAMASPMGGVACDLDDNQRTDFVFALNPDTLFWSDGWKERSDATGIRRLPVLPGHVYPPMGWALGCLDADGDGRLDLLEVYGNDATSFVDPTHDSGPQPIKLFSIDKQWKARDLTAAAGLGRLGQWHSLTMGDVDGDGAPDFGVGGWGDLPRVYLNRTGVPTAAVRLRTQHGQPAVAARVESASVRWDATSVTPLSQSDTMVFVTRTNGQATVHFADGTVQTGAVKLGQGTIIAAVAP